MTERKLACEWLFKANDRQAHRARAHFRPWRGEPVSEGDAGQRPHFWEQTLYQARLCGLAVRSSQSWNCGTFGTVELVVPNLCEGAVTREHGLFCSGPCSQQATQEQLVLMGRIWGRLCPKVGCEHLRDRSFPRPESLLVTDPRKTS